MMLIRQALKNPFMFYFIYGLSTYHYSCYESITILQVMSSEIFQCCDEMISKWEELMSNSDGKFEIDVWPFLQIMTSDIISKTAFGSSYEEGKKIFQLLKEQTGLIMKLRNVYIPGWR